MIGITVTYSDDRVMGISGVVDVMTFYPQAHGFFQRYCEHFGIVSN